MITMTIAAAAIVDGIIIFNTLYHFIARSPKYIPPFFVS